MMRTNNRFTQILMFIAVACLLSLLLSKPVMTSEPYKNETLAFLRVVDDTGAYKRNPDKFEAVTISGVRTSHVIYVERVPSFSIPITEISSVTIEKEKIYGGKAGVEEMVKDSLSPQSAKQKTEETYPFGYVYKATLTLTKPAKKKMDDFANSHEQQAFDLRLGKNRLGIVQFVGIFGGPDDQKNAVATFLETTNPSDIQKILAPIQDRVIWK